MELTQLSQLFYDFLPAIKNRLTFWASLRYISLRCIIFVLFCEFCKDGLAGAYVVANFYLNV